MIMGDYRAVGATHGWTYISCGYNLAFCLLFFASMAVKV